MASSGISEETIRKRKKKNKKEKNDFYDKYEKSSQENGGDAFVATLANHAG
jgi:pyoverdine/dityrosine biosynthesis protein Dit1